ncbi:putative cytochrome P450 12a4, mitochondrial, partial [Stegodyphus mimosarum]
MQDVARDFVQKVYETRDFNKEVPDLLGELYKWALESVAFVGLDTRLGCLKTNLPPDSDGMKMIRSVQTQFECMNKLEAFSGNIQFWKYFPTPTWKKFTQECDIFTEIAFKYIYRALEEMKKKEGNEDKELTLLQAMLSTEGLDASGAMVTVADMLMAGIDTTSHSVGFLLYNLAKNPDKQQILYEEISKLLPSKNLRVTPKVFSELKYLKSCMKESQRTHPIVGGTARQLERDVILSGYKVPAGTLIAVVLQEIYRDEKYFKSPEKFLPERWLGKEDKHHPYSFLPFGFGTRSCIGRRLAELEIISLITEIIRNFKVEYHYEDIEMLTRMINVPDKPLRINFIER